MRTLVIGTHLLTAVAVTPAAGQTVPVDVESVIRRIDTGIAAEAFLTADGTDAGTEFFADLVQVDRPTTPREELIGELRAWKFLSSNWDGEGAHAPNTASIEAAVSFVNGLTDRQPIPEPMLHASGRAGLYWNDEGLYADLEFTGNGHLTYYIEKNKEKHKGTVLYAKGNVPAVLAALLSL